MTWRQSWRIMRAEQRRAAEIGVPYSWYSAMQHALRMEQLDEAILDVVCRLERHRRDLLRETGKLVDWSMTEGVRT